MQVQTITISRPAAINLIRTTAGKLFSIRFVKADATEQKRTVRTGVKKNLKHVMSQDKRRKIAQTYIRLFDMKKNGYILVNLEKIEELKIAGIRYRIDV